MSAITCLIGKSLKGLVDAEETEAIARLYKKHYTELAGEVAAGELDPVVAADTLKDILKSKVGLPEELKSKLTNWDKHQKAAKKTLAVLDANEGVRINKAATTAKAKERLTKLLETTTKQLSPSEAAKADIPVANIKGLDKNRQVIQALNEFIWQDKVNLHGELLSPIRSVMEEFQPNRIGYQNLKARNLEAEIRNVKSKTGPVTEQAKKIADSIDTMIIAGNKLLREHGFRIVDPEDVRWPLYMDRTKIVGNLQNRALNRESFVSLLKRGADIEYINKQIPETQNIDPDVLFTSLHKYFAGETFDDGSTKNINYDMVARFLSFKDAEAEKAFTSAFGQESLYQTIINYADDVSRQVTARKWYGSDFKKTALSVFPDAESAEYASVMPEYMTGRFAENDPTWYSKAINMGIKPVLATAQLGGTIIQAIGGDPITAASTSAMSWALRDGDPFVTTFTRATNEIIYSFLSSFASGFQSRTRLVNEVSKVAAMVEFLQERSISDLRGVDGVVPSKASNYLWNTFNFVSYLQGITQRHKAFQVLSTGWRLAEYVGKPFDDLPTNVKKDLRVAGMTNELWEKITPDDLVDANGSFNIPHKAVSATKLYNSNDAGKRLAGEAIGIFINLEKERAVPTSSASIRANIAKARKGNPLVAAAIDTTLTYSGWVNSTWRNTVMRMFNGFDGTFIGGASVVGQLSAIGAALVVWDGVYRQLMNIANGRDPEKMDAKFWAKSTARGIPVPFVGNYLANDGKSIFGPAGSLFMGIKEGFEKANDKTSVGENIFNTLQYAVPGTNIWYAVGAWRNLAVPALGEAFFPGYQEKLKKSSKRQAKAGKTRFWEKGELPYRSPDMSAITGDN